MRQHGARRDRATRAGCTTRADGPLMPGALSQLLARALRTRSAQERRDAHNEVHRGLVPAAAYFERLFASANELDLH